MRSKVRSWGVVLVALEAGVVASSVYLPSLSYQLVWDDINIIRLGAEGPFAAFSNSFWGKQSSNVLGRDVYYRPLVNFSLQLERVLFGERAWHFHLVNLVLHGVVTGLVAGLVWRLTGSLWGAGLAGLLFGLNPIFADSVAYISGRTDLLAGVGVFIAALALTHHLERPAWHWTGLVLLGSGWATFSKESGVLFGVAALVWLLLLKKERRWLYHDAVILVGISLVTGGYALARLAVLGSILEMRPESLYGYMVASLNGFGILISLFIFPFTAPMFIWKPENLSRPSVWSLFGLLVLGAAAFFSGFKQRPFRVGLIWATTFLFPVASLVQFGPVGRLLYLPGPGLILMVVVTCLALIRRSPRAGRPIVGTALVLLVVLVAFLWQRMGSWKNELVLFSRMTREAPNYGPGHYNLSTALLTRGDTTRALLELQRAVELDSTILPANLNLGALLQKRGALAEAAMLYRRAIRLRRGYAPAHANLALVLFKQGDHSGGITEMREVIRLAPGDAYACYNLARMFELTGQRDSAQSWALEALRLQPDNRQFRMFLENLLAK